MPIKSSFTKLFEPGRIGEMTIRNRIVLPSMGTDTGTTDGYITDSTTDYYEEKAKGGAGLVTVEWACVESHTGSISTGNLGVIRIDNDKFIPGLSQVAKAIQRQGAKAAIQILHAGGMARSSIPDFQPIAPSSIPLSPFYEFSVNPPREMTQSDIDTIVGCFAKAAERVQKAGFDGVEIHAAHFYLGAQFLSSITNKRQDAYGGTVRNRIRFLLEVIKAVREAVGPAYPVWCRISGGGTGIASGITTEELVEQAKLLEESGIQAISVSGLPPSPSYYDQSGCFVPFAETVKKVVSIPVITAGSVTPDLGERVLKEGKADFIAMGRALIADPELPNKAESGKLDDIVPCIRCQQCRRAITVGMQCSVNAAAGKEREYRLKPAAASKSVMIVGGGPAGMEAARVSALRGHRVLLYEKADRLGGQMLAAAKPPHKELIADFTRYLAGQITKLGIHVEVGTEVNKGLVTSVKPDVIILATGAVPFIPEISSIEGGNVFTAEEILSEKKEAGERVVIIGGELVACETALFLAQKGKRVTLMRRGLEFATNMMYELRSPLLNMLAVSGVCMLPNVKYEKVTSDGLSIINEKGEKHIIELDTIILAAGAKPNIELKEALVGSSFEIHTAGDCVKPRNILWAIREGFNVAHIL